MRLFLFSASVFYLLGLKIISKVEFPPFFHQKSVSTEMSTSPSKKIDNPSVNNSKVQVKKDSLIIQKTSNEKPAKLSTEKSVM
jgi:hypothetical protein